MRLYVIPTFYRSSRAPRVANELGRGLTLIHLGPVVGICRPGQRSVSREMP